MIITSQDTHERIIQAATYLFGMHGFDGTSTRDIAKLAEVNIASLNYHFKSKENLFAEVQLNVVKIFKEKITDLARDRGLSASEFTIKLFDMMASEGPCGLNQFKLILDADNHPGNFSDPHPIGFEQLSYFLDKELKSSVPLKEKLWANHVIFSYVAHSAIMSVSAFGRAYMEKYHAHASVKDYIRQLVTTVIQDLNRRF